MDGSVKIKRNGGWERTFVFYVNGRLYVKRVFIQKMLWYDSYGKGHYISVFPSIVIEYCPLSAGLVEFIISNVGKGEDIFEHVNDPDFIIDCEDPLAKPCRNLEKRCVREGYTYIAARMYTSVFNKLPSVATTNFSPRFPHLYMLYSVGCLYFGCDTGIFSRLNSVIKI